MSPIVLSTPPAHTATQASAVPHGSLSNIRCHAMRGRTRSLRRLGWPVTRCRFVMRLELYLPLVFGRLRGVVAGA